MRKKLIIIGAGGMGLEALGIARRMKDKLECVGWIDDDVALAGRTIDHLPVLGTLEQGRVRLSATGDYWFHCAIGNNAVRKLVVAKALAGGWKPATLIDPSVVIGANVQLAEGILIAPHVFVGPEATIGAYTLINVGASIGHHARLGSFSQVCPGGRVSGNCTIGEAGFVGSNGVLAPGVSLGKGATLGAASFAMKSIADGCIAVGSPAKVVIKPSI